VTSPPGLGLDEPAWQRLAGAADLIVHPAALVNHVLPYDQLFAPKTGPDGGRQAAQFDGLPADCTAEAMTTLGGHATEGYQTFNVLNPHEDGISLDTFVDWPNDAGHPLRACVRWLPVWLPWTEAETTGVIKL
jgi:thioester reductase-like protein